MAALGLGCCAWTFSGGGELGLLSGGGGELGLLSGCGARASLAAAPSSWALGLSGFSSRAPRLQSTSLEVVA